MYKPFLIGNVRYGLEEGLEPWLLPEDAWSTMSNCYLKRGVLVKRNGRTEFARMIHDVADEAIGALGSTNYTGTLANIPIRAGDLSFADGTLVITDDGDGTLSGDGSGTINYTTGAYDITFSGVTTGAVTADYNFFPGYSIVGIEPYYSGGGVITTLMVFDKRRCCKYDDGTDLLISTTATDTWTGGDYDYFWGCNARDILYVTNFTDRVKYYNGTAWANLLMDTDGDVSNNVDTCKLIFFYKERLVVLNTIEDSVEYPQRARWCLAADHTDWTNDGYVDAPTDDAISAADFIGEDLIVWFRNSVWRLKYTADPDLPFEWDRIDVGRGAYAPFGGFNYKDVMGVIGEVGINETDNLRVYGIDDKIPDAVSEFNTAYFDRIYSIPISEQKQVLISYPEIDSESNSAILVYNWEDRAWSRWDYGMNVFGFYKEVGDIPTFGDIEETFGELEIPFLGNTLQAGYPITLAGDTTGYIWKINYGGDDNGADIDFSVLSGRWNPWLKDGQKIRFGWIDFYVERNPNITMDVDFYANREPLAHTTKTITFDDGSTAEKCIVRAYNGATADFHRVGLRNSGSNQTIKIYFMCIYAKPAGAIR